jgi:hypothetical protein
MRVVDMRISGNAAHYMLPMRWNVRMSSFPAQQSRAYRGQAPDGQSGCYALHCSSLSRAGRNLLRPGR